MSDLKTDLPVYFFTMLSWEDIVFDIERKGDYCRYYRIAEITAQLESDIPMTDNTFLPKFETFRVDGPGEDNIIIRHHFSLPDLDDRDLGKKVHQHNPWVIYKGEDTWTYVGVLSKEADKNLWRVVVFSHDYTKVDIYNPNEDSFKKGNLDVLTSLPSDEILFSQLMSDRDGCYMHSSGAILEGKGLIFTGHSDAGKTTMVTMLKDKAEVLCDERNIIRRWPDGFRVHGTWSNGDLADISANSAPLRAILFLEQALENRLVPLDDKRYITGRILSYLVRPFANNDWWKKTLALVESIIHTVPCYVVRFDKSGGIVDVLRTL